MASLVTYALTNVSDVKESMGIASSDSSWDNLIIRKINQATNMIENYCGLDADHHFVEATYTNEEYNGTGTNDLILRARPVTAVADLGVRSTSENIDDWDSFNSEDYFILEHSGIIRGLASTTLGTQGYRVTYTAGYSTIPPDLAEACVLLVTNLLQDDNVDGSVKRKQEGRRTIEYFDKTANKNWIEELGIDDMLNRYVMPSFAGF